MSFCIVACSVLLAAGCAATPRHTDDLGTDALSQRATALRGAVDAQWEAIRIAHDQGKRLESVYVFTIAEFRTGAIRAQAMAVIGRSSDRTEAEKWLGEAEAALPKVLAAGAFE